MKEVDIIPLDRSGSDDIEVAYCETVEEIAEWFAENAGCPVMIGLMAFWKDNGEEVFSAYVPDPDGKVRPGAY